MAQPYVGEIRMFAGNFAPAGWMFCDGQLLPISENETLFNLIGTTYGGDGQSTFALPDLQSRIPIHQGNGIQLAETMGTETVTLTTQQIPIHTHPLIAAKSNGTATNPGGNVLAGSVSSVQPYVEDQASLNTNNNNITPIGGSQPHENVQPYLCVNYIISLFGLFPHQ
ncbi:MAG TPA: tail fiber protein [Pyrinomonadaceae bacterium]